MGKADVPGSGTHLGVQEATKPQFDGTFRVAKPASGRRAALGVQVRPLLGKTSPMRSSIFARALLACTLLFFVGCGDDDDDGAASTASSSRESTESPGVPPTTAPAAGSDGSEGPSTDDPYEAQLMLSGLAEVPGPGSPGRASADITYDGEELCFSFETDGVGAVTAGHIHAGAANVAGPVVVNFQLTIPDDGPVDERCLPDDESIAGVFADPGAHYVNLHTAEFPEGAVRAQLPAL